MHGQIYIKRNFLSLSSTHVKVCIANVPSICLHTHNVVDHVLNSDFHKIQLGSGLQEPNCCVRRGVSVILLCVCDTAEPSSLSCKLAQGRPYVLWFKQNRICACGVKPQDILKAKTAVVKCAVRCLAVRNASTPVSISVQWHTYCGPAKSHWQSCLLLLDKELLTPKMEMQLLHSVTSRHIETTGIPFSTARYCGKFGVSPPGESRRNSTFLINSNKREILKSILVFKAEIFSSLPPS